MTQTLTPQLEWRAVRLRPTRFGWAYLGFCALMLIGCINYQLSLGYFFTFLLLALWPLGALHALRGMLGLALSARAQNEPFVGETALFQLEASAPPGPARALLVRARGGETALELAADGTARSMFELPARRRGRLRLPPLEASHSDSLGLWLARANFPLKAETLVFPALEADPPPLPALDTRQPQREPLPSSGRGRPTPGEGDEFAGLRPYQPGDSRRQIAWKHASRGDTLLTKHYESPPTQALWLSWREVGGALETEARISRLATWAVRAERAGVRSALELPSARLEPGHGEAHLKRALTALALFEGVGRGGEKQSRGEGDHSS